MRPIDEDAPASLQWQDELARYLVETGVELATYVPDARLRGVINGFETRGVTVRVLTREEECVAYACGYAAAGGRPVTLMQCSGLGNALNAIASLAVPYGLGLPLILSMRGSLGESNPAQVPMGRATGPLLDALGIHRFSLWSESQVRETARGVGRLAYETDSVVAMMLEPSLGGGREHN